jgi:hypothetical protein
MTKLQLLQNGRYNSFVGNFILYKKGSIQFLSICRRFGHGHELKSEKKTSTIFTKYFNKITGLFPPEQIYKKI